MAQNKKKIIVAGPCAIETKTEFFETINTISNYVDIIRCG